MVQAERMRIALAVVVAVLLSAPALAAGPDPARLVLRASDLPSTFAVDPDKTGVRTNEREFRQEPEAGRVLRRAQRITGYQAEFTRGANTLASRVDLLRTSAGATLVLDYVDRDMRKSGFRGLHRERMAIGDEGWLYGDRKGAVVTMVVWREGRVFSGVIATRVRRSLVVSLARVQQRRIAAALR
jgi:hypothetical protein